MTAPLHPSGRRRGFALLFSLAILVLLSVFALSFANLTRIERMAATNVRLQVQAAALARAGLSQACGEARTAAGQRTWFEASDWWANGTVHPVQAPVPPCANCSAPASSFDVECLACGNALPPAPPPEGVVLAQNAYGGLDRVQILSLDAASKLNVNLRTNSLPRALEIVGIPAADVTKLLAARNAMGAIRSRDELRAILGDALFRKVQDYITVHGTPRLRPQGSGSGDLPLSYAIATDADFPVSLNGAPKEVLHAVLAGIEGQPIQVATEPVSDWLSHEFRAGRGYVTTGSKLTMSEAVAKKLAEEIIHCRRIEPGDLNYASMPFKGPFRTWQQFDEFLTALEGRFPDYGPIEHALIRAAVHPDSGYMGYNPDLAQRTGGLMFDRLGISKLTTTLTLGGSGILEVRATGWITERDTPPTSFVAQASIDAVVRVFTPVHTTTQSALELAWKSPNRTMYQTLPEPESVSPDPNSGHFRLTTEHLVPAGEAIYSTSFRGTNPTAPYAFTRVSAVGQPLRSKGVVAPDGFLVYRRDRIADNARMMTTVDLPESMAQTGSAGFWVKLAGDQLQGTDEVLLTICVDDTNSWDATLRAALADTVTPAVGFSLPAKVGATIKVERFRGRLRATWWYWGVGSPGAISRFALTLHEVQKDISSWKPGEWHHVVVRWTNTLQNWPRAAAGNPLTIGEVAGDGIKIIIDDDENNPIAEDMFKYATLLTNGINSVKYNLGRSASVPTTEGITVGGFTMPAASGVNVWQTGVTNSDQLQRFTNATIDDVYVSPIVTGIPGRAATMRFERNPALLMTEFSLPVGTSFHEVGAVSAEIDVPAGCSAAIGGSVNRSSPPYVLSTTQLGTITTTGSTRQLSVRIGLGGTGTVSPILDGFTVNLLPPLQLIEELRDPP